MAMTAPRNPEAEATVAEALRVVNLALAAAGVQPLAEMPPGEEECPLERALTPLGVIYVVDETITFVTRQAAEQVSAAWSCGSRRGPGLWHVDTPAALCNFIADFDDHKIPWLLGPEYEPKFEFVPLSDAELLEQLAQPECDDDGSGESITDTLADIVDPASDDDLLTLVHGYTDAREMAELQAGADSGVATMLACT